MKISLNANLFISICRPLEPTQLLFTLSNPLDELKPILCRTSSNESNYFLYNFDVKLNKYLKYF